MVFVTSLSSLVLAAFVLIYLSVAGATFSAASLWGKRDGQKTEPCLHLSGVAVFTIQMSWAAGFILSLRHSAASGGGERFIRRRRYRHMRCYS